MSWEGPLEEGMATHFSILAWTIPWTEEPGGLHPIGLQRGGYDKQLGTHSIHASVYGSTYFLESLPTLKVAVL